MEAINYTCVNEVLQHIKYKSTQRKREILKKLFIQFTILLIVIKKLISFHLVIKKNISFMLINFGIKL